MSASRKEGEWLPTEQYTYYILLRVYRIDATSGAHHLKYYRYIVSVFEYFISFFRFGCVCCDFFVTASLFASHFLCAPLGQHKCMRKALYPLFLQTHIKGFFLFFSPTGENSSGSEERDRTIYMSCARSLYSSTVLYTILSRQALRA